MFFVNLVVIYIQFLLPMSKSIAEQVLFIFRIYKASSHWFYWLLSMKLKDTVCVMHHVHVGQGPHVNRNVN
jgi:hypothetical protein